MECSKNVWHSTGRWGSSRKCTKKVVVERDGKPYCKIHDPEYIKAKDMKKEAQWKKEREISNRNKRKHQILEELGLYMVDYVKFNPDEFDEEMHNKVLEYDKIKEEEKKDNG